MNFLSASEIDYAILGIDVKSIYAPVSSSNALLTDADLERQNARNILLSVHQEEQETGTRKETMNMITKWSAIGGTVILGFLFLKSL